MSWPVLRNLPATGCTLEELAQASQLLPSPTAVLSEGPRRTLTKILTAWLRWAWQSRTRMVVDVAPTRP